MDLNHTKIYAVLVLFAKRFFVCSFLFFIVFLMGWPFAQSFFSKAGSGEVPTKFSVLKNTMEAPRFISETDQGDGYEVWASQAQDVLSERICLINPEGKVTRTGGHWITLKAEQGEFRKKEGLLTLDRQVALQDVLGYQLQTKMATVDLKAKHVEGDYPVQASGPTGAASADGFSLQEEGQGHILVLKGNARLVINPHPSVVK
ncbi:MAG: LPS export ABC transporter periplasmic protein LptC [Alphaproteobacteria bacterium]